MAGKLCFSPYLLLSRLGFELYRRATREPAYVEVVKNLYFGRRLTACEARECGWEHVLDLAVEFTEVRPLRRPPGYRSMPVLDATAPTPGQLRSAVDWITHSAASGPVYVHCALGHGRSAGVVIAYLLLHGIVKTAREGEHLLRSVRGGVRLNREQRKRMDEFADGCREACPSRGLTLARPTSGR